MNAAHTGCERANRKGPEREKSGRRKRGRDGQEKTVDLKGCGSPRLGRSGRDSLPELRVKLRAVPSSCPPAPPKPVPTHTDGLHSRPLSIDGTLEGVLRARAPVSVPHHSQDLLNYRMEFVQVLLRPQPPLPQPPGCLPSA